MISIKQNESSRHSQPRYSISEVVNITGISAFTLRYYDKCGFFPELYRNEHKVRKFSDKDLEFLKLIDALRKSGLSIEGIQYFVRIYLQGIKSESEQLHILETQKKILEYQLAEIQNSLDVLTKEISQRRSETL